MTFGTIRTWAQSRCRRSSRPDRRRSPTRPGLVLGLFEFTVDSLGRVLTWHTTSASASPAIAVPETLARPSPYGASLSSPGHFSLGSDAALRVQCNEMPSHGVQRVLGQLGYEIPGGGSELTFIVMI